MQCSMFLQWICLLYSHHLKMSHSMYPPGFCMKVENKRHWPWVQTLGLGQWLSIALTGTLSSSRAIVHTVNCLLLLVVLAVNSCYYHCRSPLSWLKRPYRSFFDLISHCLGSLWNVRKINVPARSEFSLLVFQRRQWVYFTWFWKPMNQRAASSFPMKPSDSKMRGRPCHGLILNV